MNAQTMIQDLIEAGFSTYGIRDEVNAVIEGKPISQPTIYRHWKQQSKRPRRPLIRALYVLHKQYRPDLYRSEGALKPLADSRSEPGKGESNA